MLSSDLIKKIRQIEIRTRHLVNDSFAGEYQAVFKGRGMEFDEVRPYAPGDDVRTIDWNVTARMGQPYIKRFVEERELTVFLAVDVSPSQRFGSRARFKQELAAELAAVLAFSAASNNDKVGLLTFSDRIEHYVSPHKGRSAMLRILRDLLTFEGVAKQNQFSDMAHGQGTNITLALETMQRILKRRSILFLISDFKVEAYSYKRALAVVNRHHDCIAFDLADPLEEEIPAIGLLALQDAETKRFALMDTSAKIWRKQFKEKAALLEEEKRSVLRAANVDHIPIRTNEDYVEKLVSFFKNRAKR